jgi:hypothetical protein
VPASGRSAAGTVSTQPRSPLPASSKNGCWRRCSPSPRTNTGVCDGSGSSSPRSRKGAQRPRPRRPHGADETGSGKDCWRHALDRAPRRELLDNADHHNVSGGCHDVRSAFPIEQPGDEALRRRSASPRTVERAVPPAHPCAALAVRAIAVAACGSSSNPSSSGSADTQAVRYAECMRANGMPNFPDPGSHCVLPSPALPASRAARKACAKLQPVGLHLGGPPAPTAAGRAATCASSALSRSGRDSSACPSCHKSRTSAVVAGRPMIDVPGRPANPDRRSVTILGRGVSFGMTDEIP